MPERFGGDAAKNNPICPLDGLLTICNFKNVFRQLQVKQ